MVPEFKQRTGPSDNEPSMCTDLPLKRGETVAIRNYDSTDTHEVTIRLRDADDEVVVSRTRTIPPRGVVLISEPIKRGVYCVEAHIDEACLASTECLLGPVPTETALVELGNGIANVAEGLI
jgi:hypothetical protein